MKINANSRKNIKRTLVWPLSIALLGVILASIGLTTYASIIWFARGLDDASTFDTFLPVVGIMSLSVVIGTALTLSGIAVTAAGVIESFELIASLNIARPTRRSLSCLK